MKNHKNHAQFTRPSPLNVAVPANMSSVKGDNGNSGFTPDRNYGVWGDTLSGYGVIGCATASQSGGIGVLGSGNVIGVRGVGDAKDTSVGVEGTGTDKGVSGISDSGEGVNGICVNRGTGVHGDTPNGWGIWGDAFIGTGIYGASGQDDKSRITDYGNEK